MSNLFYRNPRLLLLALALIAVSGLSALRVLPRAEDPELLPRNATVLTRFPGASAERVEALVTEKIEEELEEVEELKLVESTSRTGVSVLSLELLDEVRDVDEVWSRVRDRLADVQPLLPRGAAAPELEEFDVRAYSLIVGLAWTGAGPPNRAVLQRHAEELSDLLLAVPGTDKTERFGELDEEILVAVDAAELASLGLTPAELARLVAESDAKVAAGTVRGRANDLLIEVEGELDALAQLDRVPVQTARDGSVVRLGDVARIERTAREPASEAALLGGRPGIAVGALLRPGWRVDRWIEDALAAVEEYRAELPRGLAAEVLFDQSTYTEERLDGLLQNLFTGALLVMLVVLFTMGWRSALLVGAALPLAVLMVFAGMALLGIPMHQMSVTGLIIALGLLIDNAIVTVDEVRHRLDAGDRPAGAIAGAARRLAVPLLGSTLTTVLAFLPIVLMPGSAGEFVGTMAVSVILALISSLFLSLTVVPALTGFAERLRFGGGGPRWLRSGLGSRRLAGLYGRGLEALYARPLAAVLLLALVPAAGFFAGSRLDEQFFPPADRDQFQLELRLAQQASLDETLAVAREAGALLAEHPAVSAVHWFAGTGAPKFYYNLLLVEEAPYYAQALVQLRSAEGAPAAIRELQRALDEAFPGAWFLARQLEQGPPFDAPLELHVSGPDLDVLRALGDELRAELASVPGVIHTRSTLADGRPKLLLRSDEIETRRAGLSRSELARRLEATLEGALGGSLLEETAELPVRVRVDGADRSDLERVASLELAPTPGTGSASDSGARGWTPLESLGRLELVPELASIPHRHGRRTNTVMGYLEAGRLPAPALAAARARLAGGGFTLPPGYALEIGGESAERDRAVGNLMASVGVLLVLMVATLVLSFQSFRLAAVIGAVGFLSVGLSLGALAVAGYPFGFMAIVGTMGLIGVAINDSIVVLSALRADPRARAGDREAVRAVVLRSTRHVVSTTITTAAGFTPLILAGGEFWPPVAVAIAGGVSGATLLALGFVPAAFLLTRRLPSPFRRERAAVPAVPGKAVAAQA